MTYAKSRDEELETKTEILRGRDETWDLRDRDRESKKWVSRLHQWSMHFFMEFV